MKARRVFEDKAELLIDFGHPSVGSKRSWAKVITSIDPSKPGGYAFEGRWLREKGSIANTGDYIVGVFSVGSWKHPASEIRLYKVPEDLGEDWTELTPILTLPYNTFGDAVIAVREIARVVKSRTTFKESVPEELVETLRQLLDKYSKDIILEALKLAEKPTGNIAYVLATHIEKDFDFIVVKTRDGRTILRIPPDSVRAVYLDPVTGRYFIEVPTPIAGKLYEDFRGYILRKLPEYFVRTEYSISENGLELGPPIEDPIQHLREFLEERGFPARGEGVKYPKTALDLEVSRAKSYYYGPEYTVHVAIGSGVVYIEDYFMTEKGTWTVVKVGENTVLFRA
ncbi:hypothetical protein [Pyrococcus kukulkanii]|uniref:hypothetical protein n=1 Tax=Pyrococcus kukulkanii TaxID=1609559 RepID=UPI00356A1700